MNHDGKAISPIFLILIGFLVLTVASALVPARFIGLKQPRSSYTPIDYTKLKTVEEFTKDADNDGKITWRELVESNVDDPTVPIVEEGDTPDPEIAKALSDPNNLTASLTKNLYVTSVYLKNNNITDEESQRRAMEGLTQEEIDKTVSKKYLPPDIKVAKTEDRTTIKAYGNEMAKILGKRVRSRMKWPRGPRRSRIATAT